MKTNYTEEKKDLFETLLKLKCSRASSVLDPEESSLVFVKSKKFYDLLIKNVEDKRLNFVHLILEESVDEIPHEKINLIKKSKNSEILFAEFHNDCEYLDNNDKISENCFVHPSAVLGITGLWVRKTPENKTIKMKHVGNVVLEDGVYVDACTTIHRGTFGSTKIKKDTHLSCHINVGHNCSIGTDCFIGPHVAIGGSTVIGDNVKIWQGAMIRNGIEICDNVVIGMGSVVTKSIKEPGTYMGSPARLFSKEMIKV